MLYVKLMKWKTPVLIFISILQSRFQQNITKLAKSEKETLLYAADQIGYIFVYNMEQFAPEQKSPRGFCFFSCHCLWLDKKETIKRYQNVPIHVLKVFMFCFCFFHICSAENFWRAHTSTITGYVTQRQVVCNTHTFLWSQIALVLSLKLLDNWQLAITTVRFLVVSFHLNFYCSLYT